MIASTRITSAAPSAAMVAAAAAVPTTTTTTTSTTTTRGRRRHPRLVAASASSSSGHAAKIPAAQLLEVAKQAAAAGAAVVMDAADSPRKVFSKGDALDVVTETDRRAEVAVCAAISAAFPSHPILGEEGGVQGGDVGQSEYLWVVDPIDGTCNFAHALPSFAVSVGVLRHATPVAGVIIEFTGGPGGWGTRAYAASRNGGATVDGRPLQCSRVGKLREAVVACESVWYEDEAGDWARAVWPAQRELVGGLVREARGIRCSGSAAVNLARVASGQFDAYWQWWLKPWDVAAGVLLVEEAGGRVATTGGDPYSIFDRSLLATNDALFPAMLARTGPATARLQTEMGVRLGPAGVPKGYGVRGGRQMD